jgi:hypothetical protein
MKEERKKKRNLKEKARSKTQLKQLVVDFKLDMIRL